MTAETKSCNHQLKSPPELFTGDEGISYLLFECLLCGCGITLRLNSDGEVQGEFVLPFTRQCA